MTEDDTPESYILSDEEHLRCLVAGAAQLGILPADRLARVRRVRFEQVSNGTVLSLWLKTGVAPDPPPPDAASIRLSLLGLGLETVPTVKQIERWTRTELEQVARWTLTTAIGGPYLDLPEVLTKHKPRKKPAGVVEN